MNRTGRSVAAASGARADFRDSVLTALLAACFLLSGVAALLYQTAWTREFALVFGTSELAVATVLAAYMAGLALGAALAERWLPRIRRPVLVYAGLELGIGVSAIALVPALLHISDWALRSFFGGQPAPPDSTQTSVSVFYVVSAFLVLAVPTVLMGATLPLLAQHTVHTEAQIGSRIGALYAVNTAGAVGGALATAFWLLPRFGLSGTVRIGAAINVLVFLFAALLARFAEPRRVEWRATRPLGARLALSLPRVPAPSWILLLMLLSGAVSFFHEVLWTRMLSHVLGSSIHAFGVMVASFLAGIALGGGLGAWLARSRRWVVPAFALSQLACAITAAAAYLLMDRFMPPPHRLTATASFGVAILMPLTFFIGTTFPVAVRILADSADQAPRASARVYAWNTVGAIVGALAAGFFIIPWLKFEGSIHVAVAASCMLAVASIWLLAPPAKTLGLAVTACAIAAAALFRPAMPELLLRTSPMNILNTGRILYYDVGRSASVVMLEQDGSLALRTNGLPEAMIDMPGTPPRFSGEFWLSPLAVIARPSTRSMLVVGYGGGVVIEGVPPSVRTIDVIELEPRVIDANRATRSKRRRDPLLDPRVNLITNDARGALALTKRKYDAIVSQPSHPWTAGASHLYTLEFMQQAREHLNDGGVFVQWMNVTFLDEALLRSLTATLLRAFGEVRLYRPDPNTLVFLASTKPLPVEPALAASGIPIIYAPAHYARVGINTAEDVLTALAVDGEGARALASGAALITDDHNRMATSSVYDFGQGLTPEAVGRLLAPYDPLRHAESWIYRNYRDRFAFDYIARREAMFVGVDASTVDRLEEMAQALGESAAADAARIAALDATGERDRARQLTRESVQRFPDDQGLRYTYVRPWIDAIARGTATPEIAAAASRLGDSAAAVIKAARYNAELDFHALMQLDPVLARIPWTAAWKLDAVQARADWRGRLSGDSRKPAGEECIALIDQAIVVQPTLILYQDRARCALAADRPDVLLESLWYFGQGTYANSLRLTPDDRRRAKRDLETVVRIVKQVTQAPANAARLDPARVKEVLEKLQANIDRLSQL
ncbi:MAG TPA: fused MFS/spermidine synthase [Steroidobacteraceae bacterium]|nr:fused MFS/spermidine synthase [Steroidobacteraceae bacterium]